MKTPRYCYHFPRPALTVDMVVWGYDNKQLYLLLIQRKNEPYKNKWALPGGFVDEDETAEQAANRELFEETHVEGITLEQLYTVSTLNRDPRGRTVSVIFHAICHRDDVNPSAGDDAGHLDWFPADNLPPLAFDHHDVLQIARNQLKQRAAYLKIGPDIFQKPFTKRAIVDCYNAVLMGSGEKAFHLFFNTGCITVDPSSGQFVFDPVKVQQFHQEGFIRKF